MSDQSNKPKSISERLGSLSEKMNNWIDIRYKRAMLHYDLYCSEIVNKDEEDNIIF